MLEEYTVRFLIVAWMRALWGRRSCALMFRPGEVVRSTSPRHLIKKLMLKAVRPFPTVTIATILPFELDPAFSAIADDWIHDPQLWDLDPESGGGSTPIASELRHRAANRPIVAAIGAQNQGKGFDFFADLWACDARVREQRLFVAAGKVAEASKPAADAFEAAGGLLIDRFISDAELLDLYHEASQVWGCYAPDYDQASGIFGRSVQTGRPVLVRQDSYMERLAGLLGHPVTALPWDAPAEAAAMLLASSTDAPPAGQVAAMRSRSVQVLGRALGLDLG